MGWSLLFEKSAKKQFSALDRVVQDRIALFLDGRLLKANDPRTLGKPLQGKQYSGLWSFRVGDYRLVCSFEETVLIVHVIGVGHRSEIYERLLR